jgi:hypothetical protein
MTVAAVIGGIHRDTLSLPSSVSALLQAAALMAAIVMLGWTAPDGISRARL